MRTVRAVVLAIVATLALAGGIASTADAGTRPVKAAPTGIVDGSGNGYEQVDPSDPLVPPGP